MMQLRELSAPEPYVMANEVWAKVEARLRRLIVADVFRGEGNAVRRVLQKGMKTVRCRDVAHIKAEFTWILGAQDNLLAPVAKNVAGETRGVLRPIVGQAPLQFANDKVLPLLRIVSTDPVSREPAPRHVALPPHEE